MPITLLVDLEETLLDTSAAGFLPTYYAALADHLCDLVPQALLLSALHSGIRRMRLSHDPSQTLQQAFDAEFFGRFPAHADGLRRRVDLFYRTVFPSLGRMAGARPGAQDLIDWARSAGHQVALATEPLFPLPATMERVRWAGIDPASFAAVASYETFHFTKEHPAYFAEVLGRLGWPDGPVVMAGNDVDGELRQAETLGLTTFHVVPAGPGAAPAAADLMRLREWIVSAEGGLQAPAFATKAAVLAMLQATPAILAGYLAGLSQAEWSGVKSAGDWALVELVCHLRDTEREVHAQQISTLVNSETPFVARPDAAVWAKQRPYRQEEGAAALKQFIAARTSAMERLSLLPDEVWTKPARHAIFGPSSLLEVIGFMAEHDRLHLRQAWRLLPARTTGTHRNDAKRV